jgi:hypothetical protein
MMGFSASLHWNVTDSLAVTQQLGLPPSPR